MTRTKQVRKKSSMMKRQTQNRPRNTSVESIMSVTSTYEDGDEETLSFLERKYNSLDEISDAFKSFFENMDAERKQSFEKSNNGIHQSIQQKLQALPATNINLNEIWPFDDLISTGNENASPNLEIPLKSTRQSRAKRNANEMYEFKRPRTPESELSRKRSASASAVPSSGNVFKTPYMTSRKMLPGSTITPKIYNNAPITIMRRPHQGEFAVSMTGSPLLVSAVHSDEIPTVNVPLLDGRVYSIMPEQGAPPPDMPQLDQVTKNYLKTLRAHLELLAPNSP